MANVIEYIWFATRGSIISADNVRIRKGWYQLYYPQLPQTFGSEAQASGLVYVTIHLQLASAKSLKGLLGSPGRSPLQFSERYFFHNLLVYSISSLFRMNTIGLRYPSDVTVHKKAITNPISNLNLALGQHNKMPLKQTKLLVGFHNINMIITTQLTGIVRPCIFRKLRIQKKRNSYTKENLHTDIL